MYNQTGEPDFDYFSNSSATRKRYHKVAFGEILNPFHDLHHDE